ncbi:MAG: sugar transferase [Acidobacteriota bacterium]
MNRFLLDSLRVADLVMMLVAFGIAVIITGQWAHTATLEDLLTFRVRLLNVFVFATFALFWHWLFRSFGLYRLPRSRYAVTEGWAIAKAVAVGTLVLAALGLALDPSAVNRVFLATFALACLLCTLAARAGLRTLLGDGRTEGRYLRKLVIVGCGPRAAEFGRQVRRKPELGYLLLGYIDEMPAPDNPVHEGTEKLLGPPREARAILSQLKADEVLISLPIKSHYETISEIIGLCREMGISIRVPADFFDSRLVHAYSDDRHHTPVLTLESQTPTGSGAALKRLVDVVISAIALIVLSPVLVAVALAILIDSGRPILFVQERVGLNRKVFKIFKFRTMAVDAEQRLDELEHLNEASGAAFKMQRDPRVTRVGRLLRKLSLDELPQLFNVLEGDMSLVGPRPLPVRDVNNIGIEWPKRRFSVKPGLTCLWQISGRHEIDFDDWMELDLQYIDNWSLSLDFDILMKTLPAVVGGHGAS